MFDKAFCYPIFKSVLFIHYSLCEGGVTVNDNGNNDSSHQNVAEIGTIAEKLLDFYDEFSEFHDYCAFLCDSFSCLASKSESIETNTANGAILFTDWMKYRAQLLKVELNDIRKQLNKFVTAGKLMPIKS